VGADEKSSEGLNEPDRDNGAAVESGAEHPGAVLFDLKAFDVVDC